MAVPTGVGPPYARCVLAGPAVGAAGAGVVVIPLVEPSGVDPLKGGLDGSDELYLRVERVPSGTN